MVISRIFTETDAKGRKHTNKQYIQIYEITPLAEYVYFSTTRDKEKAQNFTKEQGEILLNKINERVNQKFILE